MESTLPQSYSSRVTLSLYVDGNAIPLRKIGPGHCVLVTPMDLPAQTRADLVMTVDGTRRRWSVMLPNGAVPYEEVVRYVEFKRPDMRSFRD